jgi:flagellar motility protein MotE (MotC chaperone)
VKLSNGCVLLLGLMIGCSTAAKADDEPELGGSDTGEPAAADADGAEPGDEPGEDEPAEIARVRVDVDAAIKAAIDRGEGERLSIAQQRNELTALQTELDARLGGVEKLETQINELLGAGKVAEDRRRERTDLLATLIASMSPQSAATVLAQMSDAEAQDLLFAVAQSDKRRAAKLIATMPAGRAAAIGQRYLSRDPKAVGEAAAEPADALPTPPPAPAPAPAAEAPPAEPTAPSEPAPGASP